MLDSADLHTVARIGVGEHPNQIAVSPTDDRIFVACASSNCVSVIDTRRGIVTETIHTALFPQAPEGSTPDALAIAPDGKTLFVANADNNCVAVIDVATPKPQPGEGLHPHRLVSDGGRRHARRQAALDRRRQGKPDQGQPVRRPKSDRSKSNADPSPARPARPFPYIGTTLSGSLSIVPVPDDKTLAALYRDGLQELPVLRQAADRRPLSEKTAIPTRVGDPSPIKYVLYIIKENRTYDQVFGDMTARQRRPIACDVRRDVTPNHHKLAEEFVLLDNLYCNGHVSADGHPWSTMAYNTDYIARNWALTYSGRAGIHDDDDGDLANAPSGYLWDACARAGLSYRSYGEYGRRVSQPDGSFKMEGAVPGLVGHMSPDFGASKAGRPTHPRPGLRRYVHPRIPRIREEQHLAAVHGDEPGRRPHHRHPARYVYTPGPAWPATTWPWAESSKPSATASTGPRSPSSSSRTTPRTAPTTSTPTAPSVW